MYVMLLIFWVFTKLWICGISWLTFLNTVSLIHFFNTFIRYDMRAICLAFGKVLVSTLVNWAFGGFWNKWTNKLFIYLFTYSFIFYIWHIALTGYFRCLLDGPAHGGGGGVPFKVAALWLMMPLQCFFHLKILNQGYWQYVGNVTLLSNSQKISAVWWGLNPGVYALLSQNYSVLKTILAPPQISMRL